jgi:hypothetical protein
MITDEIKVLIKKIALYPGRLSLSFSFGFKSRKKKKKNSGQGLVGSMS